MTEGFDTVYNNPDISPPVGSFTDRSDILEKYLNEQLACKTRLLQKLAENAKENGLSEVTISTDEFKTDNLFVMRIKIQRIREQLNELESLIGAMENVTQGEDPPKASPCEGTHTSDASH